MVNGAQTIAEGQANAAIGRLAFVFPLYFVTIGQGVTVNGVEEKN